MTLHFQSNFISLNLLSHTKILKSNLISQEFFNGFCHGKFSIGSHLVIDKED